MAAFTLWLSIVLGVTVMTVCVWLLGLAAWGADELLDEGWDRRRR